MALGDERGEQLVLVSETVGGVEEVEGSAGGDELRT